MDLDEDLNYFLSMRYNTWISSIVNREHRCEFFHRLKNPLLSSILSPIFTIFILNKNPHSEY
jgi:hypothetical protein